MINEKTYARFAEKVSLPDSETGCMEWTGSRLPAGYGQFWYEGRMFYAHRFAYMAAFGEIPEGEGHHGTVIRHLCDNPSCTRPDHLEAGSQGDNMRDRLERGRFSNGRERRTHCPLGHALEGKNLSPTHLREGRRSCYACANARRNRRYWKNKGVIWSEDQFAESADRLFSRYAAA